MKIFCLADTQAESAHLKKYLTIAQPLLKKADLVVHLGDGIAKAKPLLDDYSHVVYVKGNHDSTNDPHEYRLNWHGVRLLFVHGEGNPWREQPNIWLNKIRNRLGHPPLLDSYYARLYKKYTHQCDVLVYGHIHIPKLETNRGTTFFCPGGLPPNRLLFNTPPTVGEIELKLKEGRPMADFRTYALDLADIKPKLLWKSSRIGRVTKPLRISEKPR